LALACKASAEGIDFTTLVPCGVYDDAIVVNGALVSTDDTVSQYVATLTEDMGKAHLKISLSVEISYGDSIYFAFGGDAYEDYLRIQCDGRWKIWLGDDDIQGFEEIQTPHFTGSHIFDLELVFGTSCRRLISVNGSDINGALSLSSFDFSPSPWQGAGGDFSLWQYGFVSVSGDGSALSMDCATFNPATLLLIR